MSHLSKPFKCITLCVFLTFVSPPPGLDENLNNTIRNNKMNNFISVDKLLMFFTDLNCLLNEY